MSVATFGPAGVWAGQDEGRIQMIRAKAPLRISFAGGGTDFPHWYNEHDGAVLCATIDQYARATLYPRRDQVVRLRSLELGYSVDYDMGREPVYDGVLDLAKAAIRRLGASTGMDLDVHSDAPARSGLGGSSALTAAVSGAVANYMGLHPGLYELAHLNYQVEREDIKISGGTQDQYATTFGGFNMVEFTKRGVLVNPLRIDPIVLNDLEAHLLLCYTGHPRTSGNLIDMQIQFYREKREGTSESMKRLYEIAFEMKEALLRGNLHLFGELLHRGFESKKGMNPEVTAGTNIDGMYSAAREHGAVGGKLTGAGGGGYLVLYCETDKQYAVRKALEALGGRFVSFSFEAQGLQVWRSTCR